MKKVSKVNKESAVFYERQHFKILWLQILLIITTLGTIAILAFSMYEMSREESSSLITYLFSGSMIAIMLLIFYSFIFGYLETIITKDGIFFRLFPLTIKYRQIEKSEIAAFYSRKYSPLGEYGGWGIRKGLGKKGNAWNAYGNYGLQLELVGDKERVLIGTQKPKEFELAVAGITGKSVKKEFVNK